MSYEGQLRKIVLFFCLFHNLMSIILDTCFPGGTVVKESTCQCRRCGLDPWVEKIPWKWKWQPAPVFLPRKFHGQGGLVCCSPWGLKESDTTERQTELNPLFKIPRVALVVKNPPANTRDLRDTSSIPESERSPGEGSGNPL